MTDFHFLRPFWLLLIVALPLVYVTLRHLRLGDSGWSRLIPDNLLAPVIRHHGNAGQKNASPILPVSLAVALLAIALAGPAWREAPTPLKQPGDSLVIALDLSLSMLATDLEPDRLTLAKRKIRDILELRDGSLNGLIVYAADAHVVTPLTDDSKTIEGMLGVLDPVIMPATGNRADLAISRARALLEQGAPGRGRILLITDEVSTRYLSSIKDTLKGTEISLSTLVVGTEQGGPIPLAKRGFIRDNGDIVIARADPEGLAALARGNGGGSHELTLDNADIRYLDLSPSDSDQWQETENGLTINRWQDDGYWLLWLALPLMLLGWRRGAFTAITLTFLPLMPQPAQAMDWAALWQREDQRAPELIQQNPDQATKLLQTPEWRGSALYKSGKFQEAAKEFSGVEGPLADYNRGNALARAGKLEQAIEAYDTALEQSPELEDAQYNRNLVDELLRQQQQNSSQQQNSENSQDSSQQQDSDQSSGNQDQQQQNSQSGSGSNEDPGQQSQQSSGNEQGQDNSSENRPADGQKQQENANTDQQSGEDGQKEMAEAPARISEKPLTQGQEQWLRRIPDNPGGLLKRKFLQQYQQRETPSDEGDTPW
ncbi:VWA domain-containing protein [Marinobacter sediminum]|uniref:VWA domain-containing protein n=1 Tax=Marinobacter sediminum TaxID=256323 RepID=UPI0020308FFF|nr:VWA domain-containing protein [Marinobacter sediminum]MCM0611570.1 VWA domain-containing protein [Marinobacter sediminum]